MIIQNHRNNDKFRKNLEDMGQDICWTTIQLILSIMHLDFGRSPLID